MHIDDSVKIAELMSKKGLTYEWYSRIFKRRAGFVLQ
jgi:hypothetical protein